MVKFYRNRLRNKEIQKKGRPHGDRADPFPDFHFFEKDFNKNWSSHRKSPQNSIGTIDFEIGQILRPTDAITGFWRYYLSFTVIF